MRIQSPRPNPNRPLANCVQKWAAAFCLISCLGCLLLPSWSSCSADTVVQLIQLFSWCGSSAGAATEMYGCSAGTAARLALLLGWCCCLLVHLLWLCGCMLGWCDFSADEAARLMRLLGWCVCSPGAAARLVRLLSTWYHGAADHTDITLNISCVRRPAELALLRPPRIELIGISDRQIRF